MKEISVLENFSEFPGLRHCSISENSGEQFYHQVLNKEFANAYELKIILTVNLDNTAGYASSFLDEALGNLVYDFTLYIVEKYIKIISTQEPHWKIMIEKETYVEWESRRKEGKSPVVTKEHAAWFRLVNNQLINNVWEHPAV